MTKNLKDTANVIFNMNVGDSYDFDVVIGGDTYYAGAECIYTMDLKRVIIASYGRNERDVLVSEFDSEEDIHQKLKKAFQ
ncbi:hypothetical protein L8C07_05430 [Paenibacillus sp. CMAA1739]|uniref:hypothetical protein n=1 Tax=Paenibacillus ottowii TaxID=2315729 RepID=UPI002DBBC866|nr:hypothetical protein [Paenibacillus sp. CMAA1739]MEC4565379.1 hypothetical protein [Paenibacillus sp. CMAA1739]